MDSAQTNAAHSVFNTAHSVLFCSRVAPQAELQAAHSHTMSAVRDPYLRCATQCSTGSTREFLLLDVKLSHACGFTEQCGLPLRRDSSFVQQTASLPTAPLCHLAVCFEREEGHICMHRFKVTLECYGWGKARSLNAESLYNAIPHEHWLDNPCGFRRMQSSHAHFVGCMSSCAGEDGSHAHRRACSHRSHGAKDPGACSRRCQPCVAPSPPASGPSYFGTSCQGPTGL